MGLASEKRVQDCAVNFCYFRLVTMSQLKSTLKEDCENRFGNQKRMPYTYVHVHSHVSIHLHICTYYNTTWNLLCLITTGNWCRAAFINVSPQLCHFSWSTYLMVFKPGEIFALWGLGDVIFFASPVLLPVCARVYGGLGALGGFCRLLCRPSQKAWKKWKFLAWFKPHFCHNIPFFQALKQEVCKAICRPLQCTQTSAQASRTPWRQKFPAAEWAGSSLCCCSFFTYPLQGQAHLYMNGVGHDPVWIALS